MLWKLLAADIEGIEGIGVVGTVFEKIFVLTKKVQMKRSVTGDEADGCCPQRKSLSYVGWAQYNGIFWKGGLVLKTYYLLLCFFSINSIFFVFSSKKRTPSGKEFIG